MLLEVPKSGRSSAPIVFQSSEAEAKTFRLRRRAPLLEMMGR